MKFKKVCSLLLASSMVFLVACGKADNGTKKEAKIKEGGTITFQAGSDPRVLNPMYGNDRVTMTINSVLYAPLFYDYEGKREYVLAESFEASKDFLTYKLKLKKDLKWDDGKALTIDDVIFTLDKVMDPAQKSLLRGSFIMENKPVEYKKTGDLEMEFKLTKVNASFEASLAGFAPIPKHVFEGEADIAKSTKNEAPVGSGAYKFKDSKKGESITLVRNDNYVGGKAHIDTVVYRIVGDQNSANSAFLNGELSAKYITPRDVEKFEKKANIETFDEGMLINLIMSFKNPALAKTEVRQAIAYALDKDELIKAAYLDEKYATKAYSLMAPTTKSYTSDVEKFDKNLEKAKELMTKSGVKDLKLRLLCVNGKKEDEAYTLILQQRLKEIGIEVVPMALERSAFLQKIFTPEEASSFDLAINGYVMGTEPNEYRQVAETTGESNISQYSNKELDELWEKANLETDAKKRDEMYKDLQKSIAKDLPLYPVAYPKSIIAVDKKVGGIKEAKPAPIYMFRDLSKLYLTE